MKHHDLTNWNGYCKLTLRIAPDAHTLAERLLNDFHADMAEYVLLTRGILPDLVAYIRGIGRVVR